MTTLLMSMNVLAMAVAAKFNQLQMKNTNNVRFGSRNESHIFGNFGFNFVFVLLFLFSFLVCYLGYGSPAKLLSSAIKKVISAPTELDCKNECIRYRENTPFKCLSFSYG